MDPLARQSNFQNQKGSKNTLLSGGQVGWLHTARVRQDAPLAARPRAMSSVVHVGGLNNGNRVIGYRAIWAML